MSRVTELVDADRMLALKRDVSDTASVAAAVAAVAATRARFGANTDKRVEHGDAQRVDLSKRLRAQSSSSVSSMVPRPMAGEVVVPQSMPRV